MTNVSGQQDFVLCLAGDIDFTVCETAVLEVGVDNDFVNAVSEFFQATVWHAKAPLVACIGGTLWNYIRLTGQREDMFLQLRQWQRGTNGDAVAEDVQVRFREVYDLLSGR